MERAGNLLRLVASLFLAFAIFVGRLALVLLAIVPSWIGRFMDRACSRFRSLSRPFCSRFRACSRFGFRPAPPAPPPLAGRRPRVLFVGGTINHTTQVQQIAAALPECEPAFTWYYCDGVLEVLRAPGLRWNPPRSVASCAPAASPT